MKTWTQIEIDTWNEFYPPGSPCVVQMKGSPPRTTNTRSHAWLLGSGHAVVLVNGATGGIALDVCKMLETHEGRAL